MEDAQDDESVDMIALAMSDPDAALQASTQLLARGPTSSEEVVLRRCRGLALRRLQRLEESVVELRAGLSFAKGSCEADDVALVASSLAVSLLNLGEVQEALPLLREASRSATGASKAEVLLQLGGAHLVTGDPKSALAPLTEGVRLARQHSRTDLEGNLLQNRGIAHFYANRYVRARADMTDAIVIYEMNGDEFSAAETQNNLALVQSRMGNLREALDLFEQSSAVLTDLGVPQAATYNDRCEVLMAAGFFAEALESADAALRFFGQSGNARERLVALGFAVDAATALENHERAIELADQAVTPAGTEFPVPLLAQCRLGRARAKLALGKLDESDLAFAKATTLLCFEQGYRSLALRSELTEAEIALAVGQLDLVAEVVQRTASRARRSSLAVRSRYWRLVLSLRSAEDNARGAKRALRAGLSTLSGALSLTTGFEDRVHLLRHTQRLVQEAIPVLLHSDESALRPMFELQRSAGMAWAAEVDRTDASASEVRESVARARHEASAGSAKALNELAVAERSAMPLNPSRRGLDRDTSLVTYFEFQNALWRIHERYDHRSVECLGGVGALVSSMDELAFLERQLARVAGLRAQTAAGMRTSYDNVRVALAASLVPEALGARVVINPTSAMAQLSWGALPSLTERAHVVAPALSVSQRSLPRPVVKVCAIGGGDLQHARREAACVAAIYGESQTEAAEVPAGLDVLHLAGHFVNAASNPLMSGVATDVGHIRAYDLLALRSAPAICVISSCESGQSQSRGGAAYGFASATLAAGSAAVIVAQSLVEDGDATVHAAELLHTNLCSGRGPAEALADLRKDFVGSGRESLANGFVCQGTGW